MGSTDHASIDQSALLVLERGVVQPPRCPRKEIRLNFQTLLEGWIRVELIVRRKMWPPQLQGGIEGYTFADCDLIRGHSLSHTVTWRSKSVLPQLEGDEELALRFHLSRAKLFAIHPDASARSRLATSAPWSARTSRWTHPLTSLRRMRFCPKPAEIV